MSSSRPSDSRKTDIIHPAAGKLLTLAIQAEGEHRYMTARDLYNEGIQILFDNVRDIADASLKNSLMVKVRQYIERAEELKRLIEAEKRKPHGYHEQITIPEGATGYGFEKVFREYLDTDLTEVEVDDPYIRANHQIQLFLRFCGTLVKHGRALKTIRLKTTGDPNSTNRNQQLTRLDDIRVGLLKRGISLFIEYSDTLHDREIRLNNGWIIKIGRGLDYFKRPDGPNSIDFFELDFRQCLATTVDYIFKPVSPTSRSDFRTK